MQWVTALVNWLMTPDAQRVLATLAFAIRDFWVEISRYIGFSG